MSQRESGYARIELDAYQTPAWVTRALTPYLRPSLRIWEPACGAGQMVTALRGCGFNVTGTDLTDGDNFLAHRSMPPYDAIITNPPYFLARQFIEHAIDLMRPAGGMVAMLLRTDFDHAKTRQHLFGGNRIFSRKIVLTRAGRPDHALAVNLVAKARSIGRDASAVAKAWGGYAETWSMRAMVGCSIIADNLHLLREPVF